VFPLVGITGENSGAGFVDMSFVNAPGPTPGAGLLSLAFLILVGASAKARDFLRFPV
jgi:hypothetical protein